MSPKKAPNEKLFVDKNENIYVNGTNIINEFSLQGAWWENFEIGLFLLIAWSQQQSKGKAGKRQVSSVTRMEWSGLSFIASLDT